MSLSRLLISNNLLFRFLDLNWKLILKSNVWWNEENSNGWSVLNTIRKKSSSFELQIMIFWPSLIVITISEGWRKLLLISKKRITEFYHFKNSNHSSLKTSKLLKMLKRWSKKKSLQCYTTSIKRETSVYLTSQVWRNIMRQNRNF